MSERDDAPFGVVVNPSSALGRGARVARQVLAELGRRGVPATEVSGADAAACRAAVQAACASGLRGLILVGGDGLLGLVLQLPEARALPVGVVPAGTGNDFARQFTLSKRPTHAVRRILAAESRPQAVDLGVVRCGGSDSGGATQDHWFAGGLSIGFDAAINRRANALRLPIGAMRYHVALLAELLTLRSRPFRVTLNGDAHRFTGLLATAMNTRAIGGGIPLAPRATTDDGLLDLVEVSHGTRLRIFSVLGLLAQGKHEPLPEVTITRVTQARIEAGDEVAYADGERVGSGPFEIRSAPGALTLLA